MPPWVSMKRGNSAGDAKRDELGGRWDLLAALLLGMATVGSSVSIYLSAWWGSLESRRLGESSAVRSESIRASNVAAGQADVDVSIFTAIVAALAHGDQRLAHYLARRARDEFRPALQAWERLPRVGEEGGEISSPPGTPFDLPEYRLAAWEKSDRLRKQADEILAQAYRANTVGTAYVMPTILFSTVLFLAGIGSKLRPTPARITLSMASVVLVVAALLHEAIASARSGGRVAVTGQQIEQELVFAVYDDGTRNASCHVDGLALESAHALGGRVWSAHPAEGHLNLFSVPLYRDAN